MLTQATAAIPTLSQPASRGFIRSTSPRCKHAPRARLEITHRFAVFANCQAMQRVDVNVVSHRSHASIGQSELADAGMGAAEAAEVIGVAGIADLVHDRELDLPRAGRRVQRSRVPGKSQIGALMVAVPNGAVGFVTAEGAIGIARVVDREYLAIDRAAGAGQTRRGVELDE